eukprot:g12079.t1
MSPRPTIPFIANTIPRTEPCSMRRTTMTLGRCGCLGVAYRAAMAEPDEVHVIDWAPYGPSSGKLASFLSIGVKRENQLVGVFSIQLVPALKPRNSSRFLEERHKNRGNMTAGQHAGFLRVISQVLLRMCFLLWSDLFGSDGLEML